MRLLSAALVAGIAGVANAQLVVGNDQTSPSLWHIDLGTNVRTNLLTGANATAWGLAYNPNANVLYWNNGTALRSATFDLEGLVPTAAVTITVNGTGSSMTGLAYDSVTNTLVGYRSVTAPGFYRINPTTGVATIIAATPASTDFGGFDFDVATGTFYASNDGTGLQGRGVYRITDMFESPVYTRIAPYNPSTDTDIDGLGVGGGKTYLVNDTSAQPIQVLDLSNNTYGTTISSPFTATNGIFSAGTYIIPAPGALALLGLGGLAAARRRR